MMLTGLLGNLAFWANTDNGDAHARVIPALVVFRKVRRFMGLSPGL
jgi:hypothetical protein